MKIVYSFTFGFILIAFYLKPTIAQIRSAQPPPHNAICPEPIYPMDQVTTRAQILQLDRPPYPPELLANGGNGQVRLEAVLCKTGNVTDIRVLESNVPAGVIQQCMHAIARMKFVPAKKNDRFVSQRFRFRFTFKVEPTPLPTPTPSQPSQ